MFVHVPVAEPLRIRAPGKPDDFTYVFKLPLELLPEIERLFISAIILDSERVNGQLCQP